MFRSKKGFTLVELLAVIVILAIILAIAVPGIAGIVDSTRKGAAESDAKMIVAGIEYQQLQASIGATADITVSENHVLTAEEIKAVGANDADYETIKIITESPIQICVETKTSSKFGIKKLLATRSTVTDLSSGTCAEHTK
jgi:type IV pilus assembly protein PilA